MSKRRIRRVKPAQYDPDLKFGEGENRVEILSLQKVEVYISGKLVSRGNLPPRQRTLRSAERIGKELYVSVQEYAKTVERAKLQS
ncbi:MAG: hypothetical protein COT81_00560 [Candidatus Buchananbacteria bacterium CG10_big_fil_rev_8_21_14_0_10_42_9]|uniref:Uncharacterized protein n=1 Tax=Candidatus Buchananbacteria bacterium CG10_big_fil_rev_8_21_14_0_10_42_9 TaxID=1974526 RepID=A0A2H0W298_9BACT|nr:MAG: hypothetical protein COT81_00560 [Candidatus Buchananbacteria bacterium CG10_big_fil_rev_8_21_14_0_10_42_9]